MSSQYVIGSFEARFFCARSKSVLFNKKWLAATRSAELGGELRRASGLTAESSTASSDQISTHGPDCGLGAIRDADFSQDVLDVFLHGLVADPQ